MTQEAPKGNDRPRVSVDCSAGGRTHQSFKDECDVNVVMRRFANNGVMPTTNKGVPSYGDFTTVGSFLDAQMSVIDAQLDFAKLPSAVRKACGNSPAKFLEMCQDPDRVEELMDLGMKDRELPPTMVKIIKDAEEEAPEGPA